MDIFCNEIEFTVDWKHFRYTFRCTIPNMESRQLGRKKEEDNLEDNQFPQSHGLIY